MMNLKTSSVVFASMGILLASCATTNTPVALYAQTANTLISIDEGFDQEVEYEFMIGDGQLKLQQPHFMDVVPTSDLQNDWVEVRELLSTLKETQRLQNQQRVFIKMEASILVALASVIETNDITLPEVDAAAVVEAQASLEATKLVLQSLRTEIRELMVELRQLFRSVNRPMMWNEALVVDVQTILTELIPLTDSFQNELVTILPSLQLIRGLLIASIPADLSPLTDEVLIALALFETQLATLSSLQDSLIGSRSETRENVKAIRELVAALRANNQSLSVEQKAALTIKRLAIANAMDQLRAQQEDNMTSLQSLKDLIDITNLDQLNTILADLIASGNARQTMINTINVLFEEAKAILNA
jgi:hypothetical protein